MRKIILTIGIIIAIAMITLACQKANTYQQVDVSNEVVGKVTQTYFENKHALLKSAAPENIAAYVESVSDKIWANEQVQHLSEQRDIYLEGAGGVQQISVEVHIDALTKINTNQYKARISTYEKLTLNDRNEETGEPIVTKMLNVYDVTLRKVDGQLFVETEAQVLDPSVENTFVQSFVEAVSTNATGNPLSIIVAAKEKVKKYSGSDAAKFARKYGDRNVQCSDYYIRNGGDCTNFISHCLQAGGWDQFRDWSTTIVCRGSTASWGGADNFKRFAETTSRVSSVKSSTSHLEVGDLISVDFKGDGKYDHNMIVTLKTNRGLFVTYHSTNTIDRLLTDFIDRSRKDYKRAPTLKGIKIASTYTK